MSDLPVLATAAEAYRFLARELATIFRLSWATIVIVILVQTLLARAVFAQMATLLASGDVIAAATIARHPVWLAVKTAVEMVGTGMVAVAIHQLILFGERKAGQYIHLAFGRREALFVLLALALGAVSVLFATIVISPIGRPTAGLAPFLAALAYVVSIYASIRLWPILPMIVVDPRLNLGGAWTMTRGRFWSLLALGLLGAIPIGIVVLAIDSIWPSFDTLMDAITKSREQVPPASTAAAAVRRAQDWLFARALFDFLATVLYTALMAAIASYAYKALTGLSPGDTLVPRERPAASGEGEGGT
jgi:hypothetical protein